MSPPPPEKSPPPETARGVRALRRLLREQTCDLRGLDLPGFRRWLDRQSAHWQSDPVFLQRARIRDLRRAHPALHPLEKEHRRAAAAEASSAHSLRLRRLEQELIGAARAVSGLTAALQRATPAQRAALGQKLDAFRARQLALQEEQQGLIGSSPQRQTLLRTEAELQQLRAAVGLDREEARLDELLKAQGRRSGHSGETFEQRALQLTENYLLPNLLRGGAAARRLRVLRGVTLGAARTELVVRLPRTSGRPVEALAVVEVKRNLNDLAHGFRRRQENLAWLTGAGDGYDPGLYRTGHFRTGHFDREAVHPQDGETYLFAPGSFGRFRRATATGFFLDRLYLISRAGMMWGVSTAGLAQISFRVATDERWEPDSDSYLRGLLRWCQSLTRTIEAPDVLRMYAATPGRGRQVLLAGR
jgi:hypothetical protein